MMNNYSFKKRVSETLNIPYGASVLVAVSGGVDSMCMLHALCSIDLDLRLYVAHVNFNLRGAESDADESLVRQWCNEKGLELFVNSVDTISYCKHKGVSMEMGARELRYGWFESLIKERGIQYLFTAHNANDNAETILINLLRGTGIKGMCGIGEKVQMDGYILARPVLSYTRAEIEKYALYHNVPYRVDKTNLENDVVRNKLRNLVFPIFNKINPSAVESIGRSIKYLNSVNNIIEKVVESTRKEICVNSNEYMDKLYNWGACITNIIPVCTLDISKIEKDNQEFWLYSILNEYGFGQDVVLSIDKTLEDNSVKRFQSPEYVAVKERGYIKIYRKEDINQPKEILLDNLDGTKFYNFGKCVIKVEVVSPHKFDETLQMLHQLSGKGIMAISKEKLGKQAVIRGMKKGDSFVPYGMKGSKKISDLLTDLKVDNVTREFIPLLCSNDKVVSVIGNRIDANYAVAEGDTILLVCLVKN